MLQRYLSALGPEAARHSVISLLPAGTHAAALRALGVEVTSLGLSRGRLPLRLPQHLRQLRAQLRTAAPSVVHGWMYHGCLAAWAGLAGRGPARPGLVWAIHHSLQDIRNEKRSTRLLLRILAGLSGGREVITYCSAAAQRQHEAIGFAGRRTALIPNAVDTGAFRPDPQARQRLAALCGVPRGRFFIGNCARSHPMKDHVSMVRAVAVLRAAGHDVQAVIIGEGVPGSPAAAEARRLGIADRVTALEARDDIARLMPGLDVYLLSSAWGEAFPLAVAEAMACGVPCVVTDVGDCALLVGETGAVVPPGDPQAQADAVARLLQGGPELRQARARQARARVAREFSMRRYADLHKAAYHQAMAERGRCRPDPA